MKINKEYPFGEKVSKTHVKLKHLYWLNDLKYNTGDCDVERIVLLSNIKSVEEVRIDYNKHTSSGWEHLSNAPMFKVELERHTYFIPTEGYTLSDFETILK